MRDYSLKTIIFTLVNLVTTSVLAAGIEVSGYTTLVAGKVISGNEVLADYPRVGVYDEDNSIRPDSSIGLQLKTSVTQATSFVVQVGSHGADDWKLDLDWAYLNARVTDEISVQLGRKRLPLYYYSDHFDIGYTYLWVRPPSDIYTWQISHYNGVSVNYEPRTAYWDVLFNFYLGKENSTNNELLSQLGQNDVDEKWKNIVGLVAEASREWLDVRFTFMHGQLNRTIDGYLIEDDINQQFMGVSVNIQQQHFRLLSELNRYQRPANNITIDTMMLTVGYQLDSYTPYICHSQLEQESNLAGGDEQHSTRTLGLRWDIERNTAIKFQYDKVKDEGRINRILGNGELISVSVDYVF